MIDIPSVVFIAANRTINAHSLLFASSNFKKGKRRDPAASGLTLRAPSPATPDRARIVSVLTQGRSWAAPGQLGARRDEARPPAAARRLGEVPDRGRPAALAGRPAQIHGDGEQTRDFTFVADAVAANLLAADAPRAAGRVMNVAGGRRTSLNELWDMICDEVGSEIEAHHGEPRAGDVRDSLAGIERATGLLGYSPSTDLRDGLRLTIESLRESGGPEEE